jgi:hypothetical protein
VTALLSAAGRAFLRAFVASLLVLGFGILAAPDLSHMYLVGVAALVGAFAAGLRAIQAYVKALALSTYLGHPFGDWAESFLQGFVGSLIVTLPGIAGAPDFHTEKAFIVAAIIGAFNAAVRAIQGFATTGEHPTPGAGVNPPPNP